MLAAGAGDVATPDAVSGGAFAGHQPGEGHKRGRVGKAPPVADLGGQRQGTQLPDAAVGGQARDGVGEGRRGGGLGQVGLDGRDLGVAAGRHRPVVGEGGLQLGVVEVLGA
jgi:hypothetical protein